MSGRIYLTDKEVANVLEMSAQNLSRIVCKFCRGGKVRRTNFSVSRNIMDAKPESFGGFRRWKVSKVASVLGISEDELLRRIS